MKIPICGEQIMRRLWEFGIRTAQWQAEFDTAPATEKSEAECSAAAFPKFFPFREIGIQVSLVTMSHPYLRTVAPPPCLPLDIKDSLKEDMGFLMGDGLTGGLLVRMTLLVGCWVMLKIKENMGQWKSALRTLYIGFRKAKLKKS
jgi:hypothetical protein